MIEGTINIAGAILCGGKALRLGGTPKGLITLDDGTTIIARLLDEFAQTGIPDPALLCGGSHNYDGLGKTVLPDRLPDKGPLGGIEAALMHYMDTADAVLFATCDMPCITATELSMLVTAYKESSGEIVYAETCTMGRHPLCSVVHIGLVEEVSNALAKDRLAIHRLWNDLGAERLRFDDEARFTNINTKEDLSQLRGISQR